MTGQTTTGRAATQFDQAGKNLDAGQEGFFQFTVGLLDKAQGLAQFSSTLGHFLLKAGV